MFVEDAVRDGGGAFGLCGETAENTWQGGGRDMALFEAKTKYGLVRGHSMEGYTVFKGIPYAKPPLGEGRFAAPQEPEIGRAHV